MAQLSKRQLPISQCSVYLDPINTRATLVNEEEHFPSDGLEISGNAAGLRAEIQHQDRIVKNVFVEPLLDKGNLGAKKIRCGFNLSFPISLYIIMQCGGWHSANALAGAPEFLQQCVRTALTSRSPCPIPSVSHPIYLQVSSSNVTNQSSGEQQHPYHTICFLLSHQAREFTVRGDKKQGIKVLLSRS